MVYEVWRLDQENFVPTDSELVIRGQWKIRNRSHSRAVPMNTIANALAMQMGQRHVEHVW